MTGDADPTGLSATIHLLQQATISFDARELWPQTQDETISADLAAFAAEVARRLRTDGFLGYRRGTEITLIPSQAVKRIDCTIASRSS